MSQTLLYFALYAVGASTCLASGLGRRPLLCCALAFPVGLALMVGLVLLMLLAQVPYTRATGTIAALLVIAGNAVVTARRDAASRPERRDWMRIGGASAGFLVLLLPLTFVNLSFLSFDSHYMVILGSAIFDDHALNREMTYRLTEYGAFYSVSQSGVGFTGESYLYSLSLVLGLTTTASFAAVLWHAFAALGVEARRRAPWIALITAATFSVYMLWRHFFYVHNNLGTATFMFLTVALFWLAELERDVRLVPLACLALLAFCLHRIENPIVATILLAMILPQSRLPSRAILLWLSLATAVVAAWYLRLAQIARPDSPFLTPLRCYATIAIMVALVLDLALLSLVRWRWLTALNRWLPAMIAVVVAIALAAAFHAKPDHMTTNLAIWFHNMWDSTYWQGCWAAVAVLAVLSWFVPALPHRAIFVYGAPVYLAITYLVVYARPDFRLAVDDSASRMVIHLVPIVFFYFGVTFVPRAAATSSR
jgi:hypothetical protein